jgi:hypothetical protein
MTTDPTKIAAIRERNATKGPWKSEPLTDDPFEFGCSVDGPQTTGVDWHYTPADAAFIAHARQDIPDLLAALDRAEAERVKAIRDSVVQFADVMSHANDIAKQRDAALADNARLEAERDKAFDVLNVMSKRVQRLAFQIPAPNQYTPLLVEVAVGIDNYLHTALAASEQSTLSRPGHAPGLSDRGHLGSPDVTVTAGENLADSAEQSKGSESGDPPPAVAPQAPNPADRSPSSDEKCGACKGVGFLGGRRVPVVTVTHEVRAGAITCPLCNGTGKATP